MARIEQSLESVVQAQDDIQVQISRACDACGGTGVEILAEGRTSLTSRKACPVCHGTKRRHEMVGLEIFKSLIGLPSDRVDSPT